MEYLTVKDLMKRYDISFQSGVSDRIIKGKLPRPDKIEKYGTYLWSKETITNWEATHGGNVHMFKAFLRSHASNFARFLELFPLYRKQIESLQEDGNSRQIEFSEPSSPEVNSDNDNSATRVDGIIKKLLANRSTAQQENNDLAAPEADNHDSDIDHGLHEQITGIISRVNILISDFNKLRETVHALVKIVSILTNAQRNSSGLLYGQIKAASVPLTALEKEFSDGDSLAQSEDSGE